MPKVSVLLATYNGEQYLAMQLESILNQSYQDFIIVIADDGSTDETVSILQSFQDQFPNKISYSVNKENVGLVKNFEQLIEHCQTDLMALSDQDDVWHSNKLEQQVQALQNHPDSKPILVHSDLAMVDENLQPINPSFFAYRGINLPDKKALNKIIGHNGIMGCTTLFNQALKQHLLPFPKDLNVHDYWIGLVNEVFGKRVTIQSALISYRIHSSNSSNSSDKILNKRGLFGSLFNSDLLPFRGIGREDTLHYFVNSNDLDPKDKKIIQAFIEYLENKKPALLVFYKLIRFNILKNNFRYRMKILFKLLGR